VKVILVLSTLGYFECEKHYINMNDPKHFYVTLLSTASQNIYPDNTHYDFIVDLAQTIDLGNNDRWEVGLHE
jgi:hypothetical protein